MSELKDYKKGSKTPVAYEEIELNPLLVESEGQ